jgi:hypothetical protein
MTSATWHYYLLRDPGCYPDILYRADANNLRAIRYEWWGFRARKWINAPFGGGQENMLSREFAYGSYGFEPISEERAMAVIAADREMVRVRTGLWTKAKSAVRLADLSDVRWERFTMTSVAPWPYVTAKLGAAEIVVLAKDNAPKTMAELRKIAGSKPPTLAALRRAGLPLPSCPVRNEGPADVGLVK